MSLTVGTAGHIDHGKTWLVRALTGKDTDRLPEERERGISIDLGYAPLDLPDGRRLSLIDGPVTASLRWRHLGGTTDDDDTTDFFVEEIGNYDLFDLAFSVNAGDHLTINMGVNNLFDKTPPILGSNAEQANTYPGTFDVIGRDFFISANLRF